MKTKTCCKCKIEKPISEFFKRSRAPDGLQSRCKECSHDFKEYYQRNKERYKEHAENRRQLLTEWAANIKAKTTCQTCGEGRSWCLEFHHPHSEEKHAAISDMVAHGFSKERILKEIEKCVVLCRNCHADVHWRCSLAGRAQSS